MPQYHFIAQPLLYPFIKGIEEVFLSNLGSQKTYKIHWIYWLDLHTHLEAGLESPAALQHKYCMTTVHRDPAHLSPGISRVLKQAGTPI